jgi:hypothetical protein
MPGTPHPPPSSRRAVFSHRALQQYSLPQVGLGREGGLPRPGSANSKALQYFWRAWPRVTGALRRRLSHCSNIRMALLKNSCRLAAFPWTP